jgi:hypothetical protein
VIFQRHGGKIVRGTTFPNSKSNQNETRSFHCSIVPSFHRFIVSSFHRSIASLLGTSMISMVVTLPRLGAAAPDIERQSVTGVVAAPQTGGTSTVRKFSGAVELRTPQGKPTSLAKLSVAVAAAEVHGDPMAGGRAAADAARALKLMPDGVFEDGAWWIPGSVTAAGAPLFLKSNNKSSAVLLKTSQVWPAAAGGTIPPGLDGHGRRVLMWDGGMDGTPYAAHPEFLSGGFSRIDIASGNTVDFHASAVAGTLGAAGLVTADTPGREAMGMAFDGIIRSRASGADLGDFALLGLNELQLSRVSNHSYGFDHGWTFAVVDFGGGPISYLSWEGDIAISLTESQFYGLYGSRSRELDRQAYSKPYFQPTWSSGNQRLEGPNFGLSGLLIAQHPNRVFYATFRNGAFGWTDRGITQPGVTPIFVPQLAGGTFGAAISVPPGGLPPADGGTTGFDTLEEDSVAKNVLVVGSVDGDRTMGTVETSTAHGPTDDGRMKPDVVAKGVDIITTDDTGAYVFIAGSSFAAPAVAGSANLVSFYHEDLWGAKQPMRSSTLRALISHTADDVVVIDPDPALAVAAGPDYKTGWGTMDTAEAVTKVSANFAALYQNVRMRPYVKEVFLPNGAEIDFSVKATGGLPVKVTAAWTDPAGDAQGSTVLDPADSRLINDLDLTVVRTLSGGSLQTFKPWRLNPASPAAAASRTYLDNNMNFRDNLETVETNSNGTAQQLHRIRIKQKPGSTVREVDPLTGNLVTGGQWVSIVLSGVEVTNIDFRITGQSFNFSGGNVTATLTWNAVVGEIYRIQRSTDLQTWTDNSGDIIPLMHQVTATSQPAPSGSSGFYRVTTVSANPFGLP